MSLGNMKMTGKNQKMKLIENAIKIKLKMGFDLNSLFISNS